MCHGAKRHIAAFASLVLLAFAVTPVLAAAINGTPGPDRLVGTSGTDQIRGYAGADSINGKERADWLVGGPGNDRIVGGRAGDHLYGGAGHDRLLPGPGEDYVSAGLGDDLIRAVDSDNDRFYCGDGNDTVYYDLTDAHKDRFLADDCEVRIAVGTPIAYAITDPVNCSRWFAANAPRPRSVLRDRDERILRRIPHECLVALDAQADHESARLVADRGAIAHRGIGHLAAPPEQKSPGHRHQAA